LNGAVKCCIIKVDTNTEVKALKSSLYKISVLALAAALIVTAPACGRKNNNEVVVPTNVPIVTADPEGSVTAGPTATPFVPTDAPVYTDVPIVTADPSANITAGPTATPTAAPVYTNVPIVTADPSANITAGPTATPTPVPMAVPTEAPVYTNVPIVTADPSANITEGPTATPIAAPTPAPTAAPSVTPGEPATPTPAPTDTPLPDPVTTLTWLELGKAITCDLDFDYKPETIVAELNTTSYARLLTVKVTVGKNGKVLEDSFLADEFISGLVNNFNSGDNRVEIIISSLRGTRTETVCAYRLNSTSTGLSVCKLEGSVYQVDGNSVRIHRYLDFMGTWECTSAFAFDLTNFKLVQAETDWIVLHPGERQCTAAQTLLVGLYTTGVDNMIIYFEPGARLYPTATDLSTRIDVTLESGTPGYLSVTVGPNGELLHGGEKMTDCFSDLYFMD
jgi:hypothetical protein